MPDSTTPDKDIHDIKEPEQGSIANAWKDIKDFFFDLIDLQSGLDREGTIVSIKNNKKMAGANAWLLMCSIMIASLGLDLNSPAVIIGAMLISPLMSPILGVGLAVGINDRKTLSISMKHFGIAIVIALVTSTFYFRFLTPFQDNITSEILGRTAPGLLDVAVAFFGGIAGIISGSRKDKSNAIPGVAIATALMPPLCVTGFGLANQNLTIMYNSFYLFFMNATFVALATFLIVRFLRFPQKAFANEMEHRRTQIIVTLFSIITLVPSIIIFSGVLRRVHQESTVKAYMAENYPNAFYKIDRVADSDSIIVNISLGKYLSPAKQDSIANEISEKGVEQCKLDFLQDSESRKVLESLKSTESNYKKVIKTSNEKQLEKEKIIARLNIKIDSLTGKDLLFTKLCREAKVIFPELNSISLADNALIGNLENNQTSSMPVLILDWNEEIKKPQKQKTLQAKEELLIDWIKVRADIDTLKVTH